MWRIVGTFVLLCVAGLTTAGPVGASTSTIEVVPSTIASNCSRDVSWKIQAWLDSLPAGTTAVAPAGSCYLVQGGLVLDAAQQLTISGGIWHDATTPAPGASPKGMNPIFWLVGGSDITLENMTISGVNPAGYDPPGAFEAGIRSDGVIGLTISNVVINDVYGDGVELGPLRAANDLSDVILNPTENAAISNVQVSGAGRQGITLSSVENATITSVALNHIGLDAFDVEADQWDEGALNVTINGCYVGWDAGMFFANAGVGAGGAWTGNITVENCTMAAPLGGWAILVQGPPDGRNPRGPFEFVNDTLYCGHSASVPCVQATYGHVSISNSTLTVPGGTIHETVYGAAADAALSLNGDTVTGYGSTGTADGTSSVSVSGGSWVRYRAAPGFQAPDSPSPGTPPSPPPADSSPSRAHAPSPVGHEDKTGSASGSASDSLREASDPFATAALVTSGSPRMSVLQFSAGVVAGLVLVIALMRRRARAARRPSANVSTLALLSSSESAPLLKVAPPTHVRELEGCGTWRT